MLAYRFSQWFLAGVMIRRGSWLGARAFAASRAGPTPSDPAARFQFRTAGLPQPDPYRGNGAPAALPLPVARHHTSAYLTEA